MTSTHCTWDKTVKKDPFHKNGVVINVDHGYLMFHRMRDFDESYPFQMKQPLLAECLPIKESGFRLDQKAIICMNGLFLNLIKGPPFILNPLVGVKIVLVLPIVHYRAF